MKTSLFFTAGLLALVSASPIAEPGTECFVRRSEGTLEARQCTYGPPRMEKREPGTECFVRRAEGLYERSELCTYGPGKSKVKRTPGAECFVKRGNVLERAESCTYGPGGKAKREPGVECFVRRDGILEARQCTYGP